MDTHLSAYWTWAAWPCTEAEGTSISRREQQPSSCQRKCAICGETYVQTVRSFPRQDQWAVEHGTAWTIQNRFEVLEQSAKSPCEWLQKRHISSPFRNPASAQSPKGTTVHPPTFASFFPHTYKYSFIHIPHPNPFLSIHSHIPSHPLTYTYIMVRKKLAISLVLHARLEEPCQNDGIHSGCVGFDPNSTPPSVSVPFAHLRFSFVQYL